MTDLVSPEWTLFNQIKMWWTPLLMLMVLLFRNDIFFIGKVLKVWYRVLGESFIKGFLKRQGQKYAMKIIGFLFNDHFCNSNMLLPFFKCYCSRDLSVNYTFHTFKWSPLELQKRYTIWKFIWLSTIQNIDLGVPLLHIINVHTFARIPWYCY